MEANPEPQENPFTDAMKKTLDAMVRIAWRNDNFIRTGPHTRYDLINDIYKFTSWHRVHYGHCQGICDHAGTFVGVLNNVYTTNLNYDEICRTRDRLDAMFKQANRAEGDPDVLRFREQLDEEWEAMPDRKKWQWARFWQGRYLDPWDFLGASGVEQQFIGTLVDLVLVNNWSSEAKSRKRYEVVAEIYLSEKLRVSPRTLKGEPTVEPLCDYLNDSLRSEASILSPKDIKVTRSRLLSASKDPAEQKAKTDFKRRLDDLWERMSGREKEIWRKEWEEHEPSKELKDIKWEEQVLAPKKVTLVRAALLGW